MSNTIPNVGHSRIPSELIELLTSRSGHLTVMPAVAQEALEIAKNRDGSIRDFSAVIERDVKLTAQMLRMANSSIYGRSAEVVSLHQAVHTLGFRQCKNLILTTCVSGLMKEVDLRDAWIRDILWRHGYTTAIAAMQINRLFSLGFQGEEFTAGLLHDIGRTILAMTLPDQFPEIDPLDFVERPGSDVLQREASVIKTNHADVGAWFAEHNELPEALVDVVRYHHDPWQSPGHHQLVGLIAAADDVANHLQMFDEPSGYQPEQNEGIRFLDKFGVPGIECRFAEEAFAILEQAQENARETIAC